MTEGTRIIQIIPATGWGVRLDVGEGVQMVEPLIAWAYGPADGVSIRTWRR